MAETNIDFQSDEALMNNPDVELILTPQFARKYGKFVLKSNGKFIKWCKFPATTNEMTQRQGKIRQFIKNGRIKELSETELDRLLKLYTKNQIFMDQKWLDEILMGQQV